MTTRDTPQDLASLRERMRHSASHVMADAVLQLFPEARLAIGPPTEDGFYYDFEVSRPFTPEDLEAIEARIRETIARDIPFQYEEIGREEAHGMFSHQPYKLEIIELVREHAIRHLIDGAGEDNYCDMTFSLPVSGSSLNLTLNGHDSSAGAELDYQDWLSGWRLTDFEVSDPDEYFFSEGLLGEDSFLVVLRESGIDFQRYVVARKGTVLFILMADSFGSNAAMESVNGIVELARIVQGRLP